MISPLRPLAVQGGSLYFILYRRVGDEVVDPFSAFDEHKSDAALENFKRLHDHKHRQDRQCGIARERKRDGDAYRPYVRAVENEGDDRLAAGAQRKVAGIREGIEWHHCGTDPEHVGGHLLDAVRGVVELRQQRREQRHHDADAGAECDRECDELSVLVHGALQLARA